MSTDALYILGHASKWIHVLLLEAHGSIGSKYYMLTDKEQMWLPYEMQ